MLFALRVLLCSLFLSLSLINSTPAQSQISSSVDDLAKALVKAKSHAERAKMVAQEKELALVELGRALLVQVEGLSSQQLFAQAEEVGDFALHLAEQLGEKSLTINTLRALGRVYEMQGNYPLALERYQQSFKIAEEIADRPGMARALNNIGNIHDAQGNYSEASRRYLQCLKIGEDLGDRTIMARALNNLGNISEQWGDYTLALEQYQKSLKIKYETSDRKGIATTLNNIGNVHVNQSNYAQAHELFQQSLKISEGIDDREGVARALANLGNVHHRQGNEAQALELYRQSLKISEELGIKEGIAYLQTNLGAVYFEQGEYMQAVERFQQSLKFFEDLGDQARVAQTLSNLGNVYLARNNYVEAIELFRQSLKISEEVGDKAIMIQSMNSLANVYQAQGSYTLALQFAQGAADLATRIGAIEDASQAQTAVGNAYFALNQLDQARLSFNEAIASIEILRTQVAGGEQEQQGYFKSKISPYYAMVELLIAQNNPDEALLYAERAKARVLLDVLQNGRADGTKVMTSQEQEQERKLKSQLVTLNILVSRESTLQQPDQARLIELKSQLQKARLDFEAFQINLYAAHPELKMQRGEALPLRLEDVALLPDAASVLLEYVVTDDRTYLFAITKAEGRGEVKIWAYTLLIKRDDLAKHTEIFRRQLAERDLGFRASASMLYELLLKPVQAQLRGKTNLVIVPDDKLWDLPFQALLASSNRFLIEDTAISYAPSLTALREMTKRRKNQGANPISATLLAVGNPKLGQETIHRAALTLRDEKLDPLPEAEYEVRALKRLYGASRSNIYIGAEASESRIKSEAGQVAIIHFATHGTLNDASPMYSHLVLARGNTDEDGLLEAWELMQLDLKADLAVLSACETARGRASAGEGVIGLTWALFVAGVPSTIVSQWKVESVSTRDLMLGFHRQLRVPASAKARVTKAEALRQAALKLMKNPETRHPFYWAGFVLMGAAGN